MRNNQDYKNPSVKKVFSLNTNCVGSSSKPDDFQSLYVSGAFNPKHMQQIQKKLIQTKI